MGRYEGQCGTCEHFFECRGNWDKPYDTNDSDKGYCDWYKTTYYPDDSCKHYFKRGDYRSDCYITTIVCEILGYDDDCFVLNSLRNLRDNYIQVPPIMDQKKINNYRTSNDNRFIINKSTNYTEKNNREKIKQKIFCNSRDKCGINIKKFEY